MIADGAAARRDGSRDPADRVQEETGSGSHADTRGKTGGEADPSKPFWLCSSLICFCTLLRIPRRYGGLLSISRSACRGGGGAQGGGFLGS